MSQFEELIPYLREANVFFFETGGYLYVDPPGCKFTYKIFQKQTLPTVIHFGGEETRFHYYPVSCRWVEDDLEKINQFDVPSYDMPTFLSQVGKGMMDPETGEVHMEEEDDFDIYGYLEEEDEEE